MWRLKAQLIVAAVLASAPAMSQAVAPPEDPVLAVVNGDPIHRSDLEAERVRLPEQFRQTPVEAIYDPLLGRMIDQRLLAAEARKRDIAKDPAVKAALDRAATRVLEEQLLERAIAEAATPDRLQQAYRTMSAQPGFAREEVHAYHVLLETEAEARKALADLATASDKQAAFFKIAAERSKDPSAKQNGGDLGWFTREMMVPEFAEAAFSITPMTYGQEPVKSQFGWHVIFVEAKRNQVPSFEEKEPEIRQQVAREVVTAFLNDVRQGASIQRFNLDGTPKSE